ncbi:hypothetical protein CXG81DRAFT_17255 [Caulochytrium protostelioides]|uniref:Fibrous sheath-interacting protein 1 n=1 Tax=Caulochytrium protostelioides TaxID=1555241 RepID=A0A4P9XCM5_9FUNG|nr:hypothetical protein CXG81DRAFT_17255 [Caulochytrium protostelioides]|eukprot:RKP03196.1 hypothetical protein CXG81DRAFT_17255 [Caulochytrium protostelioides]
MGSDRDNLRREESRCRPRASIPTTCAACHAAQLGRYDRHLLPSRQSYAAFLPFFCRRLHAMSASRLPAPAPPSGIPRLASQSRLLPSPSPAAAATDTPRRPPRDAAFALPLSVLASLPVDPDAARRSTAVSPSAATPSPPPSARSSRRSSASLPPRRTLPPGGAPPTKPYGLPAMPALGGRDAPPAAPRRPREPVAAASAARAARRADRAVTERPSVARGAAAGGAAMAGAAASGPPTRSQALVALVDEVDQLRRAAAGEAASAAAADAATSRAATAEARLWTMDGAASLLSITQSTLASAALRERQEDKDVYTRLMQAVLSGHDEAIRTELHRYHHNGDDDGHDGDHHDAMSRVADAVGDTVDARDAAAPAEKLLKRPSRAARSQEPLPQDLAAQLKRIQDLDHIYEKKNALHVSLSTSASEVVSIASSVSGSAEYASQEMLSAAGSEDGGSRPQSRAGSVTSQASLTSLNSASGYRRRFARARGMVAAAAAAAHAAAPSHPPAPFDAPTSQQDSDLQSVTSFKTRTFLTEPKFKRGAGPTPRQLGQQRPARSVAGSHAGSALAIEASSGSGWPPWVRQGGAAAAAVASSHRPPASHSTGRSQTEYEPGNFMQRNKVLGKDARYYDAMTVLEQQRVKALMGDDETGADGEGALAASAFEGSPEKLLDDLAKAAAQTKKKVQAQRAAAAAASDAAAEQDLAALPDDAFLPTSESISALTEIEDQLAQYIPATSRSVPPELFHWSSISTLPTAALAHDGGIDGGDDNAARLPLPPPSGAATPGAAPRMVETGPPSPSIRASRVSVAASTVTAATATAKTGSSSAHPAPARRDVKDVLYLHVEEAPLSQELASLAAVEERLAAAEAAREAAVVEVMERGLPSETLQALLDTCRAREEAWSVAASRQLQDGDDVSEMQDAASVAMEATPETAQEAASTSASAVAPSKSEGRLAASKRFGSVRHVSLDELAQLRSQLMLAYTASTAASETGSVYQSDIAASPPRPPLPLSLAAE